MLTTAAIWAVIISIPFTIEKEAIRQEDHDTTSINLLSKNALLNARINPDLSIRLGMRALAESKNILYKKGTADASLALGIAWFARYNPGDSALLYLTQAFDLYCELDDSRGKARTCYNLAYVFSLKGNLQESEKYASLSLNLFEQTGDKRGVINSYSALSYLAKQQRDLRKARELINQAIEVASTINDTIPLADALNSLGNIYKDMALFNQAIDTYFEALKLWELKRDSTGISIAYGSIGLMYFYQKEWDKALEYNLKKLPLSLASGNLWEAGKTYNTIAQIYNSISKYDSALLYFRKSLLLNKQMEFPSGIADSYHNIASSYLLMQKIDSAYYYINLALNLGKEIDAASLINYQITLGHIYKTQERYSDGLQSAFIAYNMSKKHSLPMPRYESSALISDLYSLMGHKGLAYDYLKEHQLLKDSISNDEFLKQLTRMEIQYDFDKRQRAAEYEHMQEKLLSEAKIRQQRILLSGLVILLLIFSFFSLLYLRHSSLKARYAQINLEQRLLRAQMNPHFIFNSLCAIQDLIMKGNPLNANAFLTKIARLMRNILENTREEYIPLFKEIETLKLYLDVQQLRFENGFRYVIDVDESIDPENVSIPPMFAQPCVENSIEHGLLPERKNGRINISYSLRDELMMLEVTDNGIGRKNAAEQKPLLKKESISTKLMEKRMEHFRKILNEKHISYEIIDLYDKGNAAGTRVVMMLPWKKIFV